MKSVYISGPMTGLPGYNFPAFDEARDRLQAQGYAVVSPADTERARNPGVHYGELDGHALPPGFNLRQTAFRDLEAVADCDAIHMLLGWEKSKGARAEKALAEWLGKEIMFECEGRLERKQGTRVEVMDCCMAAEREARHDRFEKCMGIADKIDATFRRSAERSTGSVRGKTSVSQKFRCPVCRGTGPFVTGMLMPFQLTCTACDHRFDSRDVPKVRVEEAEDILKLMAGVADELEAVEQDPANTGGKPWTSDPIQIFDRVEDLPDFTVPVFPDTDAGRREYPVCTGLLEYFPHACAEVAHHSFVGNEQHNPGQKMHWATEKSIGHGDQIVRHLIDGKMAADSDPESATHHFAGMCWRALELFERFLCDMEPFNKETK